MNDRLATGLEIQKFFEDQGVAYVIDGNRIKIKRSAKSPWVQGGWVDQYRVTADGRVYKR